ncbi:MAG: hypothetical protein U5N53_28400 [Mycobacterium sp.]|nr:hypothetical protein [Mycobacterium sp.]
MPKPFADHPDQFTVGERVEVMTSTDPVVLELGTVLATDGAVFVGFDGGRFANFRPFQVRSVE